VGNFWTEQTVHFVDFEGSLAAGVLEYGVVTLRGSEIISLQTRLCRPRGRIRPEDTALHGLREEALATCAPLADDWEFFAGLRETGPLAAHFAGAENSLLKSVWPYPRASSDFARGDGAMVTDWGPWLDTGRLYPQLWPALPSAKLAELIATCGLQAALDMQATALCPLARRRYHAAPYDALAGALLLAALAREPQVATLTTLQLLALSTLDGSKRDALTQGDLF
jgi:DNA polymerase III epsilon subunit-like protein